jgi:hypothetical protein
MHSRWKKRADIWFPAKDQARQWGRREALIARVDVQRPAQLVAEEAHLIDILQN